MTRKILASSICAAALSFGAAHAQTVTINAGGSSLAYPTYIAEFSQYHTAHTNVLFSYEAVGSGGGQNGFLKNNIGYFEPVSGSNSIGYAAGTLTYGTIVGTAVHIGASDAYLSSSQVSSTGTYPVPTVAGTGSLVDGPAIQIPTLGTAITIPYDESGATSTLKLTDAQICGVMSGEITDWHALVSTIPAGKKTIHVVVRSDGSGTTFLLTQHLSAVCTAANSSFPSYPVPVTKYFYNSSSSASNYVFNALPSNFVGESGSGNVQLELLGDLVGSQTTALTDTIGYLSPDFTSIAPMSASTSSLKVASVKSPDGSYYQPTVANTEKGLAHPGATSTNGTPPATMADAADPLKWVPEIPTVTAGYPIVGYTTMVLSSCYANAKIGSSIVGFLTAQYNTQAYITLIENNGFAPLVNTSASKYIGKVNSDFLTNSSGYGLNINNTKTCSASNGISGR
jgi:ABC-type phosphate transport system substrate-binding protein